MSFQTKFFQKSAKFYIGICLVMYGEHSQLGVIADNIILNCQVKYILQGGDVKQCWSFDNSALNLHLVHFWLPIPSFEGAGTHE
jgi:hypothetical protein